MSATMRTCGLMVVVGHYETYRTRTERALAHERFRPII